MFFFFIHLTCLILIFLRSVNSELAMSTLVKCISVFEKIDAKCWNNRSGCISGEKG